RVLTRLLSTMWLWFGVGTNTGAFGGLGISSIPASRTERSTEEACIVQVPGTGLFGSGHCVLTLGVVFFNHASGMWPHSLISAFPRSTPQSSPGRPPLGHSIALPAAIAPVCNGQSFLSNPSYLRSAPLHVALPTAGC